MAPCCQKQVRPQIDDQFKTVKTSVTSTITATPTTTASAATGAADSTHSSNTDNMIAKYALAGLLESGIHRERMSEMVTDRIRALLLDLAGYDTQVFEFISSEHTSKNTMIAAIKRIKTIKENDKEQEKGKEITAMVQTKAKLVNLMKLFGVHKHQLIDKFIDTDNQHIYSFSDHSLKADDIPFYSNNNKVAIQKSMIPRIRKKKRQT